MPAIGKRFIRALMTGAVVLWGLGVERAVAVPRPNIVILLADQWRAEAVGYAGNRDVKTPALDRLAGQSVDFINAVSGCPVCAPMRASLMTGQRPLTDGVFLNDVPLRNREVTIAEVLDRAGYDTGYIGKWHLNGDGRSRFIPRGRRQGFHYWKALECSHNYNHSYYYGDTPRKRLWKGYDAIAQARDAQAFLRRHAKSPRPFLLVVGWGPPHAPYHTAPLKYRRMYQPARLHTRPNVPPYLRRGVRYDLAGYYAHCTALDDCVSNIWRTLRETGLETNTILLFTADHGDLLGSHNYYRKQQPYDESIRVPMLFHCPELFGRKARALPAPISSPDIMPTLLGLCGVPIPSEVEGIDYSGYMRGGKDPSDDVALLTCPAPFGEWSRKWGGREYRGLRTKRYTYARDFRGPWLLFDDQKDPFQLNNLVGNTNFAQLETRMDDLLKRKLKETGDAFLPAAAYIKKWGYKVDSTGTVPYTP